MGKVLRSSLIVGALVATSVIGLSSTAGAAKVPVARISGTFVMRLKITESHGQWGGVPVGSPAFRRLYTFKPRCSRGGCATDLTRTAAEGRTFHDVLKPAATDPNLYIGSTTLKVDCGSDAEGLIVPLGVERTNNFKLRVTKRDSAGRALGVSMQLTSTLKSLDSRCHDGGETAEGASVQGTPTDCKGLTPKTSGSYTRTNQLGSTVHLTLTATSPSGSPLAWRIIDKTFVATPNALVWDGKGGFSVKPAARGTISLHYTVTDVGGCSAPPQAIRVVTR